MKTFEDFYRHHPALKTWVFDEVERAAENRYFSEVEDVFLEVLSKSRYDSIAFLDVIKRRLGHEKIKAGGYRHLIRMFSYLRAERGLAVDDTLDDSVVPSKDFEGSGTIMPYRAYVVKDVEPVSVNSSYMPLGGRRWKKNEAAEVYKGTFMRAVGDADEECGGKIGWKMLAVTYLYLMPRSVMFYKNGRLRKKDVSNYIKLLEDGLMLKCGNDDAYVTDLHGYKRLSWDEHFYTVVVVSEGSLSRVPYHGPFVIDAFPDGDGITVGLERI